MKPLSEKLREMANKYVFLDGLVEEAAALEAEVARLREELRLIKEGAGRW